MDQSAPSASTPAGCSPKEGSGQFSLAVIVCTRDRVQSLRRTLESLGAADRSGIALRIVVVNNSVCHEVEEVARGFQSQMPIRVVREERPGKCFALDRGILECGGAEIIAVVDDDMTVDSGWFQGVHQITRRWPDRGFFAGSSYIAWPYEGVPTWARDPSLSSWAYSVLATDRDRMIRPNCWASGNCFWFRACLLPKGYRFCDTWLTEPPLMLDFAERGFGGVVAPDARAWHHITSHLLDMDVIPRRAALEGRP